IYDQADLAVDEHVVARDVITDLDGVPQQNLIARLSATPGALRWNGRPLDADGDDIRRHGWSPGNHDTPDHV
ncbi:MAG: CoA transferase, partial [Acidimicrobiia bacterium]|nr:CoA transferase [Acidimicrobiia bacterium]